MYSSCKDHKIQRPLVKMAALRETGRGRMSPCTGEIVNRDINHVTAYFDHSRTIFRRNRQRKLNTSLLIDIHTLTHSHQPPSVQTNAGEFTNIYINEAQTVTVGQVDFGSMALRSVSKLGFNMINNDKKYISLNRYSFVSIRL